MIEYVFNYTSRSRKFLLKHQEQLHQDVLEAALIRAVRKLRKEEQNNSDVKPMKGPFKGYDRLRIGDVRSHLMVAIFGLFPFLKLTFAAIFICDALGENSRFP